MNLVLPITVMLITGAANTLLMKYQTMQAVPTGPGAPAAPFDHPFVQAYMMFFGEVFCLAAYILFREDGGYRPIKKSASQTRLGLFCVPAMFDWASTVLVNAAYLYIPASIIQMTRGSVVVFTAVFSKVFLKKQQQCHHIMGVILVFVGVTAVATSAFWHAPDDSLGTDVHHSFTASRLGIGLCLVGMLFQAGMMVFEETLLAGQNVDPLLAVGLEGFFGVILGTIILIGLAPLHIEHTGEAMYQVMMSGPLAITCLLSVMSVAFFNWSGITVTQRASATARSTIDCSRTILVWGAELGLKWHTFNPTQMYGFSILALGTLIYNGAFPGLCGEDIDPRMPILPTAKDRDSSESKQQIEIHTLRATKDTIF